MENRFLEVREVRRLLAPSFEELMYTNEEVAEIHEVVKRFLAHCHQDELAIASSYTSLSEIDRSSGAVSRAEFRSCLDDA